MTQVRKLYSLILKDSEENYYRLKINDEYFHTLPTIDTYTTQSLNKQCFLEGRSYELKRDIEDAFILYHKNGQKSLEPVFGDSLDIKTMAPKFEGKREMGLDKAEMFILNLFSNRVRDNYYSDIKVKQTFDKYGDYTVLEALKTGDYRYLINTLRDYRRFRKAVLLLAGNTNVHPSKIEFEEDKIIKSDAAILENIEAEIERIEENIPDNQVLIRAYVQKLNSLYNKREELLADLRMIDNPKKNENPRQMRLF